MQFWKGANGQQTGDPAKLAQALVTISNEEKPPLRFLAGADAVATAEQVATTLHQQANAYREVSSSMAYELGFKYPSHFTRLFKQQVGQSPNEYRSALN